MADQFEFDPRNWVIPKMKSVATDPKLCVELMKPGYIECRPETICGFDADQITALASFFEKSTGVRADKVLEYQVPHTPVHQWPLINISMEEMGDLVNDPNTGKSVAYPMYAAWSEHGGPPQVWPGGRLPDGWSFHYDAAKKEAWLEEPKAPPQSHATIAAGLRLQHALQRYAKAINRDDERDAYIDLLELGYPPSYGESAEDVAKLIEERRVKRAQAGFDGESGLGPTPGALDVAKRRVLGKDIAEIVEDHEAEFRAPYGPTVVIGADAARSESDSYVAQVKDGALIGISIVSGTALPVSAPKGGVVITEMGQGYETPPEITLTSDESPDRELPEVPLEERGFGV